MKRKRNRAATRELAVQRVEAVWNCVNVLRPDLSVDERKRLAAKFLDLARETQQSSPLTQITAPQIEEMVWHNSQCANRYCSMVLFSRELAAELNEFFGGK